MNDSRATELLVAYGPFAPLAAIPAPIRQSLESAILVGVSIVGAGLTSEFDAWASPHLGSRLSLAKEPAST
ncbi:MAG: hypothetical protein K0R99_2893 [Microbacterium sp.]|jgi:hypothetical protein|nr:hypothetical protein [Microbacterium sp.]